MSPSNSKIALEGCDFEMKKTDKYQGKLVLVMGLAKSGVVAAKLLKELGATVVINDGRELKGNDDAQAMIDLGFEVVCGGHPVSLLERGFDLIVKNPGIAYKTNPLLTCARNCGIPIVCEVEIAYAISEASFIGITATNGKTTTTMLIHEIMQAGGKSSRLAGNIGFVSSEVARKAKASDVMVTELSSFQLMGIDEFRPHVALILNITEAHLDYHTDSHEYRQAKLNLVKKQLEDDFFIYNADDAFISDNLWQSKAQAMGFSLEKKTNGAYLTDGMLYYKDEPIISVGDVLLKGAHNLQDVLGAICVCKIYGVSNEAIVKTLKRFSGVKHRLQFVAKKSGVKYYNNSKATNVMATQMALRAFNEPTILLAGGLEREHDLDDLAKDFANVKAIFAFGETGKRFKSLADKHSIHCEVFSKLEETFVAASNYVNTGDIVLLSPACASWDQFINFEARGDAFIELVKNL